VKFVTRAHAKVDRIACPWLIRRFIDKDAAFFFVASDEVQTFAKREKIIKKYGLTDPALLALARIVRGADISDRALTPESAGLYAIASGFHAQSVYDALYAWCQDRTNS